LGVQYKTAWFLGHRIHEAMRDGSLVQMGGAGGIVGADETFIHRERGKPKKRAYHHEMKVLSLVDRETKWARSVVVDDLKPAAVVPILEENIAREARVMTDEVGHYHHLRKSFADHKVARHDQEEYVWLEDPTVHTNTIEGYFSIFKREWRLSALRQAAHGLRSLAVLKRSRGCLFGRRPTLHGADLSLM
jgi:hypothetical protein